MSNDRYDDSPPPRRDRFSSSDRHISARGEEIAVRRVSWGAIIAGSLIALTVWVMLTLLGTGAGLGIAQPTAPGSGVNAGVGIGGAIWWLLSGLIAMGVGGYVAARLAGVTQTMDGVLQGVTTWAATTLVMLYLLTTAVGNVVGGAFSMASGVASAAGQSVQTVVPKAAQASGISPEQIKSKVGDLFDEQAPSSPQQMTRDQAITAMTSLTPKLIGGGSEAEQARQQMVQIVAAQSDISTDEANRKIDKWQQEMQATAEEAKQTAKTAASQAADIASMASLVAFVMLLLGLGAAAAGGAIGKRPAENRV